MTDDNAYTPVEVDTLVTKPRPHWRRRFIVLNTVLLGIPLLLMALAWIGMRGTGTQLSGASGSIGIATFAVAASFFVAPNLVLLLLWCMRPRSR